MFERPHDLIYRLINLISGPSRSHPAQTGDFFCQFRLLHLVEA
jgi:hypothetical protein